ncbi:universal stress protein [Actinoplanes sp. NPDC049599]|uniref:universal stress protein n=1 Tax=Actinoplanes sp. NPDC049599 TaxID=3363903 RepID=UPI0037AD38FE
MRDDEILVGTDGSTASQAAVRWAAREAELRALPLRIVHVFDWQWYAARFGPGDTYLDEARKVAETVVLEAEEQARAVAPAVRTRTDTLMGKPAARLLALAQDAALTVVGSRGHGGFAGLLLGSVSQRLSTHAPGPVVVVRGSGDTGQGPVVAGVDDSPAAGHVLATAFEAAEQRGARLVVVRTFLPAVPLWLDGVPATEVRTPEEDAAEHERLEGLLKPWRQKYPQISVEALVAHDSAAAVLTGVSHTAQLVVVGSRGHGTVAGVLLGSTGMQLSQHAECPVLIARPRADDGGPR